MGGGNAQKSAAARLKNMKEAGKTPEERKEASAKAAKDAVAFVCKICRTSFMVNVQPPTLYLHVTSKHPTIKDPVECFDTMAGFDPSDPKGLKKVAAAAAKGPVKPKKKKKEPEEDLLSIGLKKGKGKKKK
uniref:At2g23090-like zinc-binding domain-containing protein n=1 Tax=Proboscia inermis TaxID=420281 RepID=A0A7S0CKX8_9STRA|mmetsp:Transcript_5643/g.5889  ORF Transcript_5643/g.5889 Transcript_5643/m.5889 type:complete len:131 (+) Transcript_5643:124-516(+)|eukprot:CAMPEP_0171313778 /NCGR_PEP_ID=MMETSP0816-20121228/45373_1 /TAXON_ID=420281 /ORGANISM="Proboscia inermis, Strain CCAP1064/1" /LENGTH=130 /DNA_ID=CAMNT_0011801661 /DNA_START=84 /DNA_END=476 /DNA_ORIENTATION=+